MKLSKGLLNILLALALGLVVTFMIHTYITSKTRTATLATTPVVVADAEIPPGSILRPEVVKVVQWPQEIVPPQTAKTMKQVENRVAAVPLSKGEPVLLSKLAPEGAAAGLGGIMRPDRLAVTIRTDDVIGVAGFLHPGERVDVMVALKMLEGEEHVSKIILQDITVLGAGQKWEQTGDRKPQVVNTVTLELTPDEAEVLNLASKQGKVHLALRHQQNTKKVVTAGISTSELLRGRTVSPPTQFAATPPDVPMKRRPARSVTVIKGTEVSTKTF